MLPIVKYPTYPVELPSTKEPVVIRPFLVFEEKLLLMAREAGTPEAVLKAVKEIISNCVIESKTPIDKMTGFDLEYLFIRLRAVSVNSVVQLGFTDREDGKVYDFDVDLNDVVIVRNDNHHNKVDLGNGLTLVLKYPPTVVDPAVATAKTVTEALFITMKLMLDKLYSTDGEVWEFALETDEEITKFLSQLPVKAFEDIQLFLQTMPTLSYVIKYKNSLGNDRQIELNTLTDFFTF